MNLVSSYFSAYKVAGKTQEEIFRELCRDKEYIGLTSGNWKEKFVNLFGEMLEEMPNPRKACNMVIKEGLAAKSLPDLDPEHVYVNKFGSAHKEWGQEHYTHELGSLIYSYRLTDACLMNIFAEQFHDDWGILRYDDIIGIYTAGHDEGPWGPQNVVPVTALDIYNIIYYTSIQERYNKEVETFWGKYKDRYGEMLADTFLASAVSMYTGKLLSEYGFALARKFYSEAPSVKVRILDVYTYGSTDIILISDSADQSGRILLYIPGASIPFIEFMSVDELKRWIRMQLREESKRKAFKKHWSLYDRQDGTTSGVDSALAGIGDGSWDYDKYLLEREYMIDVKHVFQTIAHRAHNRMISDGDTQIKSNSEASRDYVLHFCETMLSQLAFIDMLVPEIGIPLNAALSLTAIGLSSDIVLNADSYEEHARGVGELVGSVVFGALNLIPVFTEFGKRLRNFAREAIPEIVGEEAYIKARFGVELHEMVSGGPPIASIDPEFPNTYLTTITNERSQLAVLKPVGGNKFLRLNPITMDEIEGHLISRVLNEDGSVRFVTGGGLYGGAPYNPFDIDFESIWTTEQLKAEAAVTGRPVGARYRNIQNALSRMHSSTHFQAKHNLGFRLIDLIDEYKSVHPDSGRVAAFNRLREQVVRSLFPEGTVSLEQTCMKAMAERGPATASFLYSRGLEGLAKQDQTLVDTLVRFWEGDVLLSHNIRGFYGYVPESIGWEVKYAISANHLSELTGEYAGRPVFEGLGFTTNREVFEHVLNKCKANGFDPLYLISDETIFLGRRYDELALVISEHSSKAGSTLGEEAGVLLEMLNELIGPAEGSHPEIEMLRKFGTSGFVNRVVNERLHGIENNFLLSEDFDFRVWDYSVPTMANYLETAADIAEQVERITTGGGVILEESLNTYKYVADNMNALANKGLTTIAFTAFPYEYAAADIAVYMSTSNMSTRLESMILTLEEGNAERPIYNLFEKARENKIRVLAFGGNDRALLSTGNEYEFLSYGGESTRNAIEQVLDSSEKYIVIAPRRFANTQKGLNYPQPGLSQYLRVPAMEVNDEGGLVFMADDAAQRTVYEFEEIREHLGPLEPQTFFFGMKSYGGADYVFPTTESRAALLVEGLDEETAARITESAQKIKDEVAELASGQAGSCGTVSIQVKTRLETLGYETGPGATVAFWRRIGPGRYEAFNHTATSVRIEGREFIVDASHLQIRPNEGEPVILLPLYDWLEEIVNRARAINPFVRRRMMTDTALTLFEPPAYSKPRKPVE